EYYDTIPSTIHSHQRIFMPRDSTNSSCQTSISRTPNISRQFVRFIDITTLSLNVKSQHIAAEKINLTAKSIAEY
ncbi:14911_t:CDS:1, partial [Funneliformis mosseae]